MSDDATPSGEDEQKEYTVTALAAHVSGDYNAKSPEDAIEKAREDIEDALKSGGFELTEIEAENSGDTNEWGIWEL